MTLDDIQTDMYKYANAFPAEEIPHINEGYEIVDHIHNYTRPKEPKKDKEETNKTSDSKGDGAAVGDLMNLKEEGEKRLKLEPKKPNLLEEDIKSAKRLLQDEKTAKLIGLISHLVYWNLFGHLNQLPLDLYHRKQLFISIQDILKQYQEDNIKVQKLFATFIMPMVVLAIRIEVEHIFKNSYPLFFLKPIHEQIAVKLIND